MYRITKVGSMGVSCAPRVLNVLVGSSSVKQKVGIEVDKSILILKENKFKIVLLKYLFI